MTARLIKSLLILILPELIFAQNELWISRYNGPADTSDYASGLVVDNSGNVYVTGYSYGMGTYADYATIKHNSSGDTVWVRRYNGPADSTDWGLCIDIDNSGNVYVTGASCGFGASYDYLTVKYDSSGDTIWTRRYNGPGDSIDFPTGIAADNLGNVYAAGRSFGSGTDYDYLIIKYDSSGDTLWTRRYNGSGNGFDWLSALAVDDLSNVYVTGYNYNIDGNYYYLTIKYDSSGGILWAREHKEAGIHSDRAYAIAVDMLGNVYITGEGGNGTAYDYLTIKYNSSGDTVWTRKYDGTASYYDRGVAVAVDKSGNVYVTGSSYGSGTEYDYGVVKYDSSGGEVWVKRYDGPKNLGDEAYSIAVDDSENVYVTGYSYGMTSFLDYATIKYDSLGDTVWVKRYNGPGNSWDEGYVVMVDNFSVYVTGYSYGSGSYADYATIKYSVGGAGREEISKIKNQSVSGGAKLEILKNPVFESTVINYQLPVKSRVELRVYDLTGRCVRVLASGKRQAGRHNVSFCKEDLFSGIYFVRLKTCNSIITHKFTILK